MAHKQQLIQFIADTIEEVTLGQTQAASVSAGQRLLDDLGLDSLDYATVLLSCEQWLGIAIDEDGIDWRTVATVEELADFFLEQRP